MNHRDDALVCAECGKEGGVSLKTCKACMQVRYCNAECQKNHWPTHKIECKLRASELRDEALFKDPPAKADCPICFLPMPVRLISCISLPPANISSVPIYDFAKANMEIAAEETEQYYPCCGKGICAGCMFSFNNADNDKCPFCNSDRADKTDEAEKIEDIMKRAEANDAASIFLLADCYYYGLNGVKQDQTRGMELYARAANLGYMKAHNNSAGVYHEKGDLKKAKFHLEAAAMAGHELARSNLGIIEFQSRNMERAVKHWTIAASTGNYIAMHELRAFFERDGGNYYVGRDTIDSVLKAYNNSCAEMKSEARDTYMRHF